ncbi:MAG: hypothetical protein KatS3mg042_0710 [Rhodothermaceae bacterium]|nr:MAG: hypothetical protein KatS3mg042_0710 [Rhodothermaceae bacterium]
MSPFTFSSARNALGLLFLVTLCFPPAGRTQVIVRDIAVDAALQDDVFGHFKRGRALVAADFDLDGDVDFFLGNPGDESMIYVNTTRNGRSRFTPLQQLLDGELAWGAAAADYDNDGDYDLYITTGANEGEGLDYLFKNMFIEEGSLRFEDVSAQAGVQGPRDANGELILTASANADWADFDLDGDVDLFVSVNKWNGSSMDGPLFEHASPRPLPLALNGPYQWGDNILYRNNGDGTFTNVTDAAGLTTSRSTRHSTWIDYDNDGDFDLYENNYNGFNFLWRNQLKETGMPIFEDVTDELVTPTDDIAYPKLSFVSCAGDFNNDGWDDLLVFMRNAGPERGSPYDEGHALFLNEQGVSFRNVAHAAGLNVRYVSDKNAGVMGSQIGDVNGDGVLDVYVGNGGPLATVADHLFVSNSLPGEDPQYDDFSDLIDFEAPVNPRTGAVYPPYPYRTHGTAIVDVDLDGMPEIVVSNGGPAFSGDEVREPNRIFKFSGWSPRPKALWVRPEGDGLHVSRDAIGARVRLKVRRTDGTSWELYRRQRGGSCFSAQNGFELFFGLSDATQVDELEVLWPDGTTTLLTEGLALNARLVVHYDGTVTTTPLASPPAKAAEAPLTTASPRPEAALAPAYPNPFNPSTELRFTLTQPGPVRLQVFDALGRHVATLAEGHRPAGTHRVTWQADHRPGGLYLIRLEAGGQVLTRSLLLIK